MEGDGVNRGLLHAWQACPIYLQARLASELYVHSQGIWRVREEEREIKIANLPMMDHEGINQREIRLGMDFGWKRN